MSKQFPNVSVLLEPTCVFLTSIIAELTVLALLYFEISSIEKIYNIATMDSVVNIQFVILIKVSMSTLKIILPFNQSTNEADNVSCFNFHPSTFYPRGMQNQAWPIIMITLFPIFPGSPAARLGHIFPGLANETSGAVCWNRGQCVDSGEAFGSQRCHSWLQPSPFV